MPTTRGRDLSAAFAVALRLGHDKPHQHKAFWLSLCFLGKLLTLCQEPNGPRNSME